MSKYKISKEYKILRLLTFPIVKIFLPIAELILGLLVKIPHGDKEVKVTKVRIPTTDNNTIDALLYEPYKCEKNPPFLFYCHGGGFVYKAAPYHYRLIKEYAKRTNCKVMAVDYRTSPKHSHLRMMKDCYDTLRWTVYNCEFLKIDINRTVIAGDSAGGNLAAALAVYAQEEELLKLAGQMLLYPVLDKRMKTESMKKYTHTPVWNAKLNKKMWELCPKNEDDNKYASPAEYSNLSIMPETYIETAEYDCLHDEGTEYAQRLRESGVKVTLNETKGTVHGFDMIKHSKTTKECVNQRIKFLNSIYEK